MTYREQIGVFYAPIESTGGNPTGTEKSQPESTIIGVQRDIYRFSEVKDLQSTRETGENLPQPSSENIEQVPPDIRELMLEQFGPRLGSRFLKVTLHGLTKQEQEQLFSEWRNPNPARIQQIQNDLTSIIMSVAAKREAIE